MIPEKNRIRIEKYITGIVKNNSSKLYAIYANPEHVHFLISRSATLSEEELATIIAESSERFINENKLVAVNLDGNNQHRLFLFPSQTLTEYANIF